MTIEAQPRAHIRIAVPDEAFSIASLLARSFAEYESSYTSEAFAATISTPDRIRDRVNEGPVWVALRNGAVIGTLSAVARGEALYLRGMAVDPTGRGDGIGHQLLERAEEFAVRNGFERLSLHTTPFLKSAIQIYERYGFSRSNEKSDDLFGTPLFTMVKNLPAAMVASYDAGTTRGVGKRPVNGGMLVGVEPTQKHFEVQHIHWYRLRDGKIVEHWATRDDIGMMRQLGLLPPVASPNAK